MNADFPSPSPAPTRSAFDALNSACFCFSLDRKALSRALDLELGQPGLSEMVRQRCPFVFAAVPLFVAASQLRRMAQVVQAIESVVALPAYREQVLATAPAIARMGTSGPLAVFFGYDFHLNQAGLSLIEVNTNAGGAMLNAVLARAQRACCAAVGAMVPTRASVAAFEKRIVDMFRREWCLSSLSGKATLATLTDMAAREETTRQLTSIAIVDVAPKEQYLYPEFLLFQQLFERHGLRAVIADPAALVWRDGVLCCGDLAIDLVYNRLTDFYLEQPGSAALREAYMQQAVVLTPHPQAHALYANKRHLALFSDAAKLQALGVPEATQDILLEHVPHTEVVDAADAQRLWDARRGLFFKPTAGFGGRAAYRGDKLTKRVWQDILAGDYVAQVLVTPGERRVDSDDTDEVNAGKSMKFDLRSYAYDSEVQWVAARLYQGQTTNFRTPRGGFAPVYSTADTSDRSLLACAAGNENDSEGRRSAYASYVFLLDDAEGVHAVTHGLYVALTRGEVTLAPLAGQTLRLADWYVRLNGAAPDTVINETYSLLHFDAQGRIDPAHTPMDTPTHTPAIAQTQPPSSGHAEVGPATENAAWPNALERERMRDLLFGNVGSSDALVVTGPGGNSITHCSNGQADTGQPTCRERGVR